MFDDSFNSALNDLVDMLGYGANEMIVQKNDDASAAPLSNGLVLVTDEEGRDVLYFNRVMVADITWDARGTWFAKATLSNGTVLRSSGGCIDNTFEPWA